MRLLNFPFVLFLFFLFGSFCSSPEKKENVIFALTLHGGHLGFFEGAVLFPQPLTWMDKVIVGYANAICQWQKQKPTCQSQDAQASGGSCSNTAS